MTEALTPFEIEIVSVFADLVLMLGLPKSVGEIYGLLFASVTPQTFLEIERKLGLSKGSVSQGLRALRELGAVKEASDDSHPPPTESEKERAKTTIEPPGTRVSRWVATIELRKLIGSLLRERLTPYLERQDKRVAAAESALASVADGLPAHHFSILENRLGKLQTWQGRARTILPVLGKML